MSPATRTKKVNEYMVAEDDGEHTSDANTNNATSTTASSRTAPNTGATNRIAETMSQMDGETADEIAGSFASDSTEASAAEVDDPAQHTALTGSGTTSEFDPVSTESSGMMDDESGLEPVEGYDGSSRESSSDLDESMIPEAFTADAEMTDREFFPILAKLAPVLVSTVLPVIKKRVLNRRTLRRVGSALGGAASLAGRLLNESGEVTESEDDIEAELEAAAEQLEVIIGTDDRIRIKNTTAIPWRRICQLTIRARNGAQYVGTGFLIGKRTVITAGHCVYIHSAGGWPAHIDVSPGRNAAVRPFGTVRAIQYRSVAGWVNSKSRNHDYGAIILPANAPGNVQSLGGFGFGYWSDSALRQRMVNLSGYPGDGGKSGPERAPGSQWWMARRIKSVSPRSFSYDIDTVGGQSGSPVWTVINGQRIALGIHTNGFIGGNSATRITKPVFDNMKLWRQQGT